MSNLFTALKYKFRQNPNSGLNQMLKTTSPDFYQKPRRQQQGFPGNSNNPQWQQQGFPSNSNNPPWQQQGFPSNSNNQPWQQQGFPSNSNNLSWQQQGFPSNSIHPHGYPSAGITSPDFAEQERPNVNPNNFVSQGSLN